MGNDLNENEKLKELILGGLEYIGFIKPNESSKNITISVNMLIEIREYLFKQSYEWYSNKFPEAYKYDIGETRKKGDAYYSDDGLNYTFNENMELENCVLFGDTENIKFDPPIPISFSIQFHKGKYYYINEIDHFFSYCINKYLLGKKEYFNKCEDGLKAILNTINNKIV
ncbi:MAG: hypothetical protein IJ054_03610 [Lachnospiraceae bacterium]|nr:hypothetical protein [Lachnospiraceae bacterium]